MFKYDIKNLKGDILGGFTVAIVALPLALAFGVASGAGAKAGLYSAILTGIFSTVFGGTPAQINGPTGAMTVVLIEVYEKLGINGLFASMLIAGVCQILLGAFKLGKYIYLIPRPVIIGFTNGIGLLIFFKMISYFKTNLVLGVITIIIMLGFPFITKKIPASLIALIAGTLIGINYIPTDAIVGTIPEGLPSFNLPEFRLNELLIVLKAGVSLAILGCIESLLASLVVDEMAGTKHHSNRELIGQGVGNTIATLFGALIGTGAIVRSAVNVNAGGRTRLSGILHGLILLAITLEFSYLASPVPLAVLGGILMGTAIKMVEYNATKEITHASKYAGITVIATTMFTVFTDLTIAVLLGTLLSMFFFVIQMASVYLKKYDINCQDIDKKIASYTIEGPLFFGVANAIVSKLEMDAEDADVIVLNLMNSPIIDSSGAIALRNIKLLLEENGQKLYFAGVKDKTLEFLKKLDVISENEEELFSKRILDVIEYVKTEAE